MVKLFHSAECMSHRTTNGHFACSLTFQSRLFREPALGLPSLGHIWAAFPGCSRSASTDGITLISPEYNRKSSGNGTPDDSRRNHTEPLQPAVSPRKP